MDLYVYVGQFVGNFPIKPTTALKKEFHLPSINKWNSLTKPYIYNNSTISSSNQSWLSVRCSTTSMGPATTMVAFLSWHQITLKLSILPCWGLVGSTCLYLFATAVMSRSINSFDFITPTTVRNIWRSARQSCARSLPLPRRFPRLRSAVPCIRHTILSRKCSFFNVSGRILMGPWITFLNWTECSINYNIKSNRLHRILRNQKVIGICICICIHQAMVHVEIADLAEWFKASHSSIWVMRFPEREHGFKPHNR